MFFEFDIFDRFRFEEQRGRTDGEMRKRLGAPIVGGRIANLLHAAHRCTHSNDTTRFFDRLPEEMGEKLNGPHKSTSVSDKFIMSAHWIYFVWSGTMLGRSNMRVPNTISPVSESFVQRYQSGHHLLNSSLLLSSSLCFAKKSQ